MAILHNLVLSAEFWGLDFGGRLPECRCGSDLETESLSSPLKITSLSAASIRTVGLLFSIQFVEFYH